MDPTLPPPNSLSIPSVRTGDPPQGGPALRAPALVRQTLTDWAPILDALTLPQRRYLAAIQRGATTQEALLRAGGNGSQGVSGGAVARWLHQSVDFARAHDAVQAGLAVMGVDAARALAVADMPDIVGHWAHKARYAERDRDQATFGRLLGEGAGLLGQGARVAVQVNTLVQVPMNPATAPGRRVVEAQSDETPPTPTPSDA